MSWFLVECLGREGISIVSVDGKRRDWTSALKLNRVIGTDFVVNKLYELRQTGKPFTKTIEGASGWFLFGVVPILGPDDDVYGMHVWLAPSADEAPSPRPAAGIRWNAGEWTVHQRQESWLMSADDAKSFEDVRSPGEFTRKVIRYDGVEEITNAAMHPTADTRFYGTAVILHDNGNVMNWQVMGRGRDDDQHRGLRALTHDVTDAEPPSFGTREAFGMRAQAGHEGDAMATMVFPASGPPLIGQWLPPIPRWVDWRRQGDRELIHPDDWAALRRTNTVLGQGEEMTTTVRLRAHTPSGWQRVTVTASRYPGPVGDRLHIVQLAKIAAAEDDPGDIGDQAQ